ncbi:hypothetical protein EB230_13100 [Mesorhizobium sp. NZP2234]|nr:hypothetical protein EB230_13100 [Mesorhizobium sp. NZP2234]
MRQGIFATAFEWLVASAPLREAWAWAVADEALMSQGWPLPGTRIAALIDLIEPDEDDLTDHAQAHSGADN